MDKTKEELQSEIICIKQQLAGERVRCDKLQSELDDAIRYINKLDKKLKRASLIINVLLDKLEEENEHE